MLRESLTAIFIGGTMGTAVVWYLYWGQQQKEKREEFEKLQNKSKTDIFTPTEEKMTCKTLEQIKEEIKIDTSERTVENVANYIIQNAGYQELAGPTSLGCRRKQREDKVDWLNSDNQGGDPIVLVELNRTLFNSREIRNSSFINRLKKENNLDLVADYMHEKWLNWFMYNTRKFNSIISDTDRVTAKLILKEKNREQKIWMMFRGDDAGNLAEYLPLKNILDNYEYFQNEDIKTFIFWSEPKEFAQRVEENEWTEKQKEVLKIRRTS